MSFLQLPDSNNLRIWNNAVFEDGASASKASTTIPLRQISTNLGTLDLRPSKENRSPVLEKSVIDFRFLRKAAETAEESAVDSEIARIEEEIARLQSRLEALRLRKADRWIAPAKILDLKQQGGSRSGSLARRDPCSPPVSKRMDLAMELAPASAASGSRRRGASARPVEIFATPARPIEFRSAAKNLWPSALNKKTTEDSSPAIDRRGVSLSPIEIHQNSLAPDRSEDKATETSRSVEDCKKQSVRKSEHIQEDKGMNKERGVNLNPKSQPPVNSKTLNNIRQPSAGAKKAAKVDHSSEIITPKALFRENKNTVSCKRQPHVAAKMRVVRSCYSLAGTRQKWSSPELTAQVEVTESKLEEQIKTDSRMPNSVDLTVSSLSSTQNTQ
ncbi:uncharacterized protein LOC121977151 [Zingiber officinale]|uniref:uncharacterized protein LOC121977151 n=1 Tax=Zingiber officinale TaxID=94328 RepID=UPI001C4C2E3D|nr:uncharacterized protein LOC121977151 [Zingiber officinale]